MNTTVTTTPINDVFNTSIKAPIILEIQSDDAIAVQIKPWKSVTVDHKFTDERVMDLLEYHMSGFVDGSLYIAGDRGVGKSSTIEQFFARLGIPVIRVNGHANMEISDLIGMFQFVDGNTRWIDGPLTMAARHGAIFLMDEADALLPEVMIGLNQVMERSSFTIPELQEEVQLHDTFRLIFAGNTAGFGDESGEYDGTNKQNSASMDRFSFCYWDHPEAIDEIGIIKSKTGYPPEMEMVVAAVLKGATDTRKADAETPSISTRSLIRWVRKMCVFQTMPMQYSFDRAIGFRYPPTVRVVLHKIMEAHIGTTEFYGEQK